MLTSRACTSAILNKGANPAISKGCLESCLGAHRFYPGKGALQILGNRRNTIKTIQKITGTMKLVAQAQLLSVMKRAKDISPFFLNFKSIIDCIFKEEEEDSSAGKVLIILITSNRGLCGSINSQIIRDTINFPKYKNSDLFIIGEKGSSILEKKFPHNQKIIKSATPGRISNFSDFSYVSNIIQDFDYDEIYLIYNKITSNNAFHIDRIKIPTLKFFNNIATTFPFEYEENYDEIFRNFSEFYTASAIHYAYSQNSASETLSRRNAMDTANKNCKELGTKIGIVYNKLRQTIITTDLIEITAGVAAIEEMA